MIERIKGFFEEEHEFIMAIPAILWQVIFLWVPLISLIGMSLFKVGKAFGLAEFTTEYYAELLNVPHFLIIGRSLLLATLSAGICLLVAYPVAYYIAIHVKKYKTALLFLLTLPFWINFLIHVYAWFFVLDRNGLLNGFLLDVGIISEPLQIINTASAVYIVLIHGYLPFMVMPLYSTLEKFNTTLFEASFDLGATRWQTFRTITLPMTASGIRSGVRFVFVASFGEYAIPSLLGGGKYMYVGQLITDYFLQARSPQLGAAFTVLSSCILIVSVVLLTAAITGRFSEGGN
ncbi:MAG: ABC transporter permease [Candidatus Babeliales bacterium]